MAAPITYSLGGVQYVAQVAGYGGSGMISVGDAAAVKTYENRGRLLVFKLNIQNLRSFETSSRTT